MDLNIDVIRETFEQVKPIADTAAKNFYKHLFADYPAAKELFKKSNLPKQRKALINALAYIVDHLEDHERLVKYLKKMGARHVEYGTKEKHYSWVGHTLIKTLAEAFGDDWTDVIEDQWILAFNFIADVMQQGAAGAEMDNIISLSKGGNINLKLPNAFKNLIRTEVRKALQKEMENEIKAIYEEELEKLKDPALVHMYINKVS